MEKQAPTFLEDLDKAVLKIMRTGGGAGTAKSTEVSLVYNDSLRWFEDENNLNISDEQRTQENAEQSLQKLRDLNLVEYIGHEEYKITDDGLNYIDGELDEAEIHPNTESRLEKLNGSIFDILFHVASYTLSLGILFLIVTGTIARTQDSGPYLVGLLIIPLVLGISLIHIQDRAKPLSERIVRNIDVGDPLASQDWSEEEKEARRQGRLDEAASAFSNAFHLRGFILLALVLWVGVAIDLTIGVSNQVYGLIFDAGGGLLLALQAIRATGRLKSSGMDLGMTDYAGQTLEVNEGVWGAFFLVTGFSIQILSLIPWYRIIDLWGYCT